MTDPDKPQDHSEENNFPKDFDFFEKVADLSSNILFVVDLQKKKVVYISKKVKELLGYDSNYLVSRGTEIFRDFIHPEDYEARMRSLEKCLSLSEEEECEVEVRIRTVDNKWEWYLLTEKIFKSNEQGEVTHAIGTAQNIHEQKISEEKLREEHRRLNDAQKIGRIGSFERELPGEIMHCSDEMYRILGIEPRPRGLPIDEFYTFVHPEDQQVLKDAVDKTHSTGKAFDTITRIVRPDKSIRHVHRKAAIIRDDKGNPLRVYGTLQDITERVKAEEERHKAENLMRSTEVLAGMGSYEVEIDTNTVFFSEGLYRLFGEEPGSFVPSIEWIDERSHPDDVPMIHDIIEKAVETNTPYKYHRRIFSKDGKVRNLEVHGRFLKDADGGSPKIIGLVQDITEKKEAEKELRRSEKRSKNLLEVLQNAPDAYLVLSKELKIEMASDAYLEATETTREQIIGRHLFEVFPDNPAAPDAKSVENLGASLEKVLETKRAHRMAIQQYDIRDKDGKFIEKYWSPTNTPVLSPEGEVDYIIHRVLDVTEIKKEQAEKRGLSSETEMLKTSLEEIKHQAKKLKENKALLQSVFDASPNSIILYKILYNDKGGVEDFRFIMANAFNHLKFDLPKNIIGERFSEVFPHVKNTVVLEEFRKTAETGEPGDFEVWYEGDGFKSWFHFRLTRRDKYLVATAEDITERKQTEETVQQMLNGSISSITLLDSVRDEKGRIIDFEFKGANKAAEKVNRLTKDQLVGGRLLELFPGVKESFFESYVQVVETGIPLRVQRYYEGENFDHWFDVSAVKNGDGFIMTFLDITEQKRAENELIQLKEELTQKATDKYKKIINSMDEGFCIIEIIRDEEGKCVDYKYLETNPVFEEQTGLTNVLGRSINELVPNIEDYWKKIYGDVALTGKAVRFEDYAEGLNRWFDVNAFRIDSPNEQHVAIIFKDITERKEAEERQKFLLKLNEALRPLEEPVRIQEAAMQILGAHLDVNRAYFSEVLDDEDTLADRRGYVKDVAPVTGIYKISDYNKEMWEKLKKGETLVLNEVPLNLMKNEEVEEDIIKKEIQAYIAVPLIKNGKLVAVISIHQKYPRSWNSLEIALVEEVCQQTWDEMQKAKAEKALKESEQRFRNLVEASALAVWETQPDGSIAVDSPSWRSFTGQTYEEWTGNGWLNAIYPDDRVRVITQWQKAVKTQTIFDMEYRMLSSSGKPHWTNVKATPIFDTEGNISRWFGMNIDINDRKLAEEALKQAKEEAEEASKAKEDFLSTMSHEIRTPLNAVIGLTNLLLEEKPREDQKENLDSLKFSARNLLALINDILDYSKLEAGKAEVSTTDFDLKALLKGIKQAHEPMAKAKDTALELKIAKETPDCIATDQLKLSQVLHNLISNAVKFTSNGKVNISVTPYKIEGDNVWLDFKVTDTGIGIPKDKLEHIFEKFAQAESSTVRQFGGTGLGLSITRLLLDLMGSGIHVESTPGKGSTFYFRLGVKKAEKKNISMELPQYDNRGALENLKVLLVEDVEINRRIITQFLKKWWQLQPDEARNGKEAVQMAKKTKYDLILMDIRMPVMDGYEATHRIRTLAGYNQTPILALTADKSQEVLQDDRETKFNGLLTKPFEPFDLKKKILSHLPVKAKEVLPVQDKPAATIENSALEEERRDEDLMLLIQKQLQEHKQNFLGALDTGSFQKLDDLQHKSKMLFEMLGLKSISRLLDKAVDHLKAGRGEIEKQAFRKEGETEFNIAIERVKDEIPTPSFDISRYLALAGKNKKVFHKLISNSVRTVELYKKEFALAAEGKNIDKLSDLIHKNTTSLHYLQANRLKKEINEYRELLRTKNADSIALKRKEEGIIRSFSILIAQLKALEE
ncbi:PAS domain S-box protein [Salinimicrobium sp. HB62]|uniref:PAS domain S-box protein n=1 Tax=Salinimicrobium sp. HB62 TaxID=3077781 RepID=UPI002D7925D9|nr:PAS domain S-box protein [Salinimicrobium sp. HB62]